jgi:ABC-2 type transport system ATP-binding protein
MVMHTVQVSHVVKSYADKVAVDDLSFSVDSGEIFGLIGPNGAGKTTTIRMIMDIIRPDKGDIAILGEELSEATKGRLGYLPEERGLYRKERVIDAIVYLASLKGMDSRAAEKRADELLEQTGMFPNRMKRIDELSKGMGQIIQFIITIVHDPELVVLDEAFSGLDPVNTEMLKGMIIDLREQGKTIVLSTHQMNQVEEMCDRIFMINHGREVLYGDLAEIRSMYRGNMVIVESDDDLGPVAGVAEKRTRKDYVELVLDGTSTPKQVLEQLVGRGLSINRFEIAAPSLNEIFLKLAGENHE